MFFLKRILFLVILVVLVKKKICKKEKKGVSIEISMGSKLNGKE